MIEFRSMMEYSSEMGYGVEWNGCVDCYGAKVAACVVYSLYRVALLEMVGYVQGLLMDLAAVLVLCFEQSLAARYYLLCSRPSAEYRME